VLVRNNDQQERKVKMELTKEKSKFVDLTIINKSVPKL